MKSRKTWREKLEIAKERRIVEIPSAMRRRLGEGKLLIPVPLDVDAMIRRIPEGRVMTTGELRKELARQFGADTTCPLCTGMFVRIAAEAAEERGGYDKTPYWRVVSDKGRLNPKLPGGVEAQAAALRREGHRVAKASASLEPAAAPGTALDASTAKKKPFTKTRMKAR
jgi:alkylated DNA nucleotide flippase Atl1